MSLALHVLADLVSKQSTDGYLASAMATAFDRLCCQISRLAILGQPPVEPVAKFESSLSYSL